MAHISTTFAVAEPFCLCIIASSSCLHVLVIRTPLLTVSPIGRAGSTQVAFFLLGTINNLPYVIVNSSAKILATR